MSVAHRRLAIGAGLTMGLVALVAGVGGSAYFARRVVVPKFSRREDLSIRSVYPGSEGQLLIELPATTHTQADGRYSLWFAQGAGHACLGQVVETSPERGSVTRVVERVDSGSLAQAAAGIWSGYVYSEPEQLGLPFRDVEIALDDGVAPAWRFNPSSADRAGTWAIHIHGMGGRRAGTLRGVPIARRLGLTSLVVSFRNDGDAPPSSDKRYRLGETEWRDVEAAIHYALAEGAERIVIFGWSLGAALALQTAALSAHTPRIVGMVLDAPVFDWRTTLRANAQAAGLPRPLVQLGFAILQSKALRWVTGLAEPIHLDALDWLARAGELRRPILILHGKKDDTTPFEASKRAATVRPDLVSLVEFESVGHSLEWNFDPHKWEHSVEDWFHGLTLPNASLEQSVAEP